MYSPSHHDDSTEIVGRAFTVKYMPRSEEVAMSFEGHYVLGFSLIGCFPL